MLRGRLWLVPPRLLAGVELQPGLQLQLVAGLVVGLVLQMPWGRVLTVVSMVVVCAMRWLGEVVVGCARAHMPREALNQSQKRVGGGAHGVK